MHVDIAYWIADSISPLKASIAERIRAIFSHAST